MTARGGALESDDSAEQEGPRHHACACRFQDQAGPQHRQAAGLVGRRVVIRPRVACEQMNEQPVGVRLPAPSAQSEPAGDRGQIDEAPPGSVLPAGIAQLAPQRVEWLAMAQHVNVEIVVGRPGAQAAQVAPGSLDLRQDVGLVSARGRIGHGGETREAELPAPEAGLAQPTAGLPRDHQNVLAFGFECFEHRPGEHRGGADSGQGSPVFRHRREPGGERFGTGDRAEQHTVVAPAARFPSEPRRVQVARAGERPGRPGAQQRTALPREHVRDRLLAELFFHHVGEDTGDVVRESLQIVRELREPVLVRVERERIEQLRAVPEVHRQTGARYDEDAPCRHQMPIVAIRSYIGPRTEKMTQNRIAPSTRVIIGPIVACSCSIDSVTLRL